MSKVFIIISLLLLGSSVPRQVESGSVNNEGLDVFFLLDKSGSINDYDSHCMAQSGLTCWKEIIVWTEEFISGVVHVIEGFDTPEINSTGLRVGLMSFAGNRRAFLKIYDGYTADVVWNALETMKTERPNGETNLYLAFEGVINQLEKDIISQPRKKVIIVLTDGEFTGDIEETYSLAKNLRQAPNNIPIYAIGVGRGVRRNQLRAITGTEHHIFNVANANHLEEILNSLILSTTTTFLAKVDPSSQICYGDNDVDSIMISGSFVAFLGVVGIEEYISCKFTDFLNNTIIVGSTVRADNFQVYCSLPGTFLWGKYMDTGTHIVGEESLELAILYHDETSVNRTLAKLNITLPLAVCIEENDTNEQFIERCAGDSPSITWNGGSASFLSNMSSVYCAFTDTTSSVETLVQPETKGTEISCRIPKDIEFVTGYDKMLSYNYVKLYDSGDGRLIREQQLLWQPLKSRACFDIENVDILEFCWHEHEATINFHGITVTNWGKDSVEWLCFIDGLSTAIHGIYHESANVVACSVPMSYLKTTAIETAIKAINISVSASKLSQQILLFEQKDLLLKIEPCLQLNVAEIKEKCIGESVPLTITGSLNAFSSIETLITSGSTNLELTCTFRSNNVLRATEARVPAHYSYSSKTINCNIPTNDDDYFGINFGTLELSTVHGSLFRVSIDEIWKEISCFSYRLNPKVSCWGTSGSALVAVGKSMSYLWNGLQKYEDTQPNLFCKYQAEGLFHWVKATFGHDNGTAVLQCPIPDALNTRSNYYDTFEVDLILDLKDEKRAIFSQQIRFPQPLQPCLFLQSLSKDKCLGDVRTLTFGGDGMEGILTTKRASSWHKTILSLKDTSIVRHTFPLELNLGNREATLSGNLDPFLSLSPQVTVEMIQPNQETAFLYVLNLSNSLAEFNLSESVVCFDSIELDSPACRGEPWLGIFRGGLTAKALIKFKPENISCIFETSEYERIYTLPQYAEASGAIICSKDSFDANTYLSVSLSWNGAFLRRERFGFSPSIGICASVFHNVSAICPSDKNYKMVFYGTSTNLAVEKGVPMRCLSESASILSEATIISDQSSNFYGGVYCLIPISSTNGYSSAKRLTFSKDVSLIFGSDENSLEFRPRIEKDTFPVAFHSPDCANLFYDCNTNSVKIVGKEVSSLLSNDDMFPYCNVRLDNGLWMHTKLNGNNDSSNEFECDSGNFSKARVYFTVEDGFTGREFVLGNNISLENEKSSCLVSKNMEKKSSQIAIAVSSTICVILICLMVVLLLYYLRKKNRRSAKDKTGYLDAIYTGKNAAESFQGIRQSRHSVEKSKIHVDVDNIYEVSGVNENRVFMKSQKPSLSKIEVDVDVDIDMYGRPRSGSKVIVQASKVFRPFGNNKSPKHEDLVSIYEEQRNLNTEFNQLHMQKLPESSTSKLDADTLYRNENIDELVEENILHTDYRTKAEGNIELDAAVNSAMYKSHDGEVAATDVFVNPLASKENRNSAEPSEKHSQLTNY